MKRIFGCIALFSVIVLTSSCSKEQLLGTMNATIEGVAWSAGTPAGTIQNNRLVITGVGQNQNITITVNAAAIGTYPIDVLNQTNYVTYTPDLNQPQGSYASVTGSITITSVGSNRVSGTFNVAVSNGSSTISITNGTFTNILYI